MFNSGPVGGAEGARRLGAALGLENVVTADMGGTSFDASVITGGEYRVLPRAEMGGFPTALTAVDISSIGAGGGSIAWIDARGLMRIGPRSAGSVPGPACYARGGEEPTVTDAAVVMGLIDPDYFLGGTIPLDGDAATAAIDGRLAGPLGFSVDEAAAGIYRLTTVQMANAIRALTVNRGHDPREFTMVSFGGACGLFAAEIARECDVAQVVIPAAASVFSAFGLLHADSLFTAVQTTPWTFAQTADDLESAYAGLQARVEEWFTADAIPAGSRHMIREADMKFAGQVFEVTTRLPDAAFTEDLKEQVRAQFIDDYETEFGSGTAWTEAEILVTNTRLKGIGKFGSDGGAPVRTLAEQDAGRRREIIEPITGRRIEVDVHRGLALGATLRGAVPRGGARHQHLRARRRDDRPRRPGQLRHRPPGEPRMSTIAPTGRDYDPVTLEVIRMRLDAIVDEMAIAMMRSSGSPVITEAGDFNTALFDAEGRIYAYSNYVQFHIGSASVALRGLLDVVAARGDGTRATRSSATTRTPRARPIRPTSRSSRRSSTTARSSPSPSRRRICSTSAG